MLAENRLSGKRFGNVKGQERAPPRGLKPWDGALSARPKVAGRVFYGNVSFQLLM